MSSELRYERLIEASPARVFDLFTSAAGRRAFYDNDAPGWVVDSHCELRIGARGRLPSAGRPASSTGTGTCLR